MFWNTQKIAEILSLPHAPLDQPIAEITTDSRKVAPGFLFAAIQGDQMDGHDFIPSAIEKGCVAILCEKPIITPESVTVFQVPSVLNALRSLAHTYRQSFSIPFVGVVGSVGKTTTKELISSILHGKYTHVLKTEGSQNGFLGIPLTLLNLKPQTEAAVIEIGIDDIGAMEQHLALVEPTHLVVTALGPEHLHQLKTVEIAAEEELKAFDYARDQGKKMAINLADPFVKTWFFHNGAKLNSSLFLTYEKADQEFLGLFPSPLPGAHHEHNLLAAITMGKLLGLTTEQMQTGLKTFKTAFGRTEIHQLPNAVTVIADYYNSNPTSLTAALQLLKSPHKNLAVLGDMLELGEQEESFHREIAKEILSCRIDGVYLYGPRMKWLLDELVKNHYSQAMHFETHEQLTQVLKANLSPQDQVLIKGSRGMKMETVFKLLQTNA
jgi:UDP-N-acetylmuramoyl-tripeptide--D-alanyl-D-alanine ligase